MQLDEIDIKVLYENYDKSIIEKLNKENVDLIYNFLISKGIYFAKDIFISNVVLYLMDYNLFKQKFNELIDKLGDDYVKKLEEDYLLIESMY